MAKNPRVIDSMAKESLSMWGKSFVFIKKAKIKTWKAIFVLAFITGGVTAIIWSISLDIHGSSKAAPANDTAWNPTSNGATSTIVNINQKYRKATWKCGGKTDSEKAPACKTTEEFYKIAKTRCEGKCLEGPSKCGPESNIVTDFCVNSPCIKCSDTDGGKNYTSKGTTIGADAYGGNRDRNATYTDKCNGKSRLMEFYCENINDNTGFGYVTMENVPCQGGCKDGACVATSSPVSVCTDSDADKKFPDNLSVAGFCSDSTGVYKDTCIDAGRAVTMHKEYYCYKEYNRDGTYINKCGSTDYNCSAYSFSSCSSGRCVK